MRTNILDAMWRKSDNSSKQIYSATEFILLTKPSNGCSFTRLEKNGCLIVPFVKYLRQ